MNYRAEIDGLRAIAVVSVILYHAQIVVFGRDWFEGGFIGVDIFFVISGYLITRIILTELEQTNTFSFIKFYERRARRILPMLLVVIAVCIPFAWQKLIPLDLVEFSKSALSAIGFGSNFFFYFSTTEYGADSALFKPLLHTWSLGVEEQFYIIAPIIILVIWKFARASLLTILVGMLIMSIQFADFMEGRNSELNFFLPFSRFWELLVGSSLAFIELKYGRTKNPILTQTLPIIGLFLIAHSIFFFDAKTPHPSFQTLTPILGVSLVLAFCSTDDFVGKILSFKPIVGVGLISYSLYLWHFSIFAFGRIGSSNPSTYDKLEWIILTISLSFISYYLIEKPSRNRVLLRTKTFFIGIVLFLITLVLGFCSVILSDGFKSRFPPIISSMANVSYNDFKQNGSVCFGRTEDFCHIQHANTDQTVIVLADSVFSSFSMNLIQALGSDYNYIEANQGGCPFILNIDKLYLNGRSANCDSEYQQRRLSSIPSSPSIILLGGNLPLYLSKKFPSYQRDRSNHIWGEELISKTSQTPKQELIETINHLLDIGHQVIYVNPLPEAPFYVSREIVKRPWDFDIQTLPLWEYRERAKETIDILNSIEHPNFHTLSPEDIFCDFRSSSCSFYDKNTFFIVDYVHLGSSASAKMALKIVEKIKRLNQNKR